MLIIIGVIRGVEKNVVVCYFESIMEEKLVDSHCHLNFKELYDDLSGVLKRAEDAGVNRFLTVCTNLEEIQEIREISLAHQNIWYSVGVHPSYAEEHLANYNIEAELEKYPNCVAIGEIGIDLYGNFPPLNKQIECFERQINTAINMKKPIIIHSRDAHDVTLQVLSKYKNSIPGVMHCFSGDIEFARKVLDLGLYISFSGVLTYKKNEILREVAKFVPDDRLLVETDSPFLSPQLYRGKVCEPAFVTATAKVLLDERKAQPGDLYHQINMNFDNLFQM